MIGMRLYIMKYLSFILLSLLFLARFSNGLAATRVWNGGGANALASTPGNWVGNVPPVTGDDIVLDSTSSKDMTWDLNISVWDWTQDGYVGTVTLATVYPGQGSFTEFIIYGDCKIITGTWTHQANTST
ncbi:MAG: hypothetical protein GX811_03070 [Lentisphaerae bacterium]|nr:hypothetical protein [Lentisphaerota bacterium]